MIQKAWRRSEGTKVCLEYPTYLLRLRFSWFPPSRRVFVLLRRTRNNLRSSHALGSLTPYSAMSGIVYVQGTLSLNPDLVVVHPKIARRAHPPPFRGQPPSPSTNRSSLLRLPVTDPVTFPGELEYVYIARGLTQLFLNSSSTSYRTGEEVKTKQTQKTILSSSSLFRYRDHSQQQLIK